ncbi:MAG: putative toxin [Arthrobacter sp.]|jgi:mRNA interferase RelE/StbE|nr:putative toxin [Arthrobacter sp.]
MAWRVEFDPAAVRELGKLEPQNARRIQTFLHNRVAMLDDPRSIDEALKGAKLGQFWKYRVWATAASSAASRTAPCAS